VILYSLPESPDILDESVTAMLDPAGWDMVLKNRLLAIKQKSASKENKLTPEEMAAECKKVVSEGKDLRSSNANRGLMGLYSSFDALVLERFVGTHKFKHLLKNESKEVYVEN
jgi:hypothetical protein